MWAFLLALGASGLLRGPIGPATPLANASTALAVVPSSRDQPVQALFDAVQASARKVPRTRPLPECSINDCSHRIRVFIGLTLLKIKALDQLEASLKTVAWVKLAWPDYRLFYNASSDLHGFPWDSATDFVPIEASDVWRPDIELLNVANMAKESESRETRAYLYDEQKAKDSGYNVLLSTPTVLNSKCSLDLRLFPFDTQSCEMQFGAWSASTRYFDFDTLDHAVVVEHLPESNEEFEVQAVDVSKGVFNYKVVDGVDFPVVTYTVTLRRHPRYYIVNYILPLGTLVVLSTGAFWLDLRNGERQGYHVTLLLTIFAVAFLAAEKLPESPQDTWLEIYQSWCLLLAVVPAAESVILDRYDAATGRTSAVPERVDGVFRLLHPVLILLALCDLVWLEPAVRQRWAWDALAVGPLSVLLLLLLASATGGAAARLRAGSKE